MNYNISIRTPTVARKTRFLPPAEVTMTNAGLPEPLGSVNSGHLCACRRCPPSAPNSCLPNQSHPVGREADNPAGVAVEPKNSGE